MRHIWSLVRPYLTVARVTVILAAVITPPAALLAGKLAVVLAEWGYTLSDGQILTAFLAGVTAVVAVVVPAVVKYLDNRTQFETALIHTERPELVAGKSISSQLHGAPAPTTTGDVPPHEDHVPDLDTGDDEFELSQPDDIAESDSDPAEAPTRVERLPERE